MKRILEDDFNWEDKPWDRDKPNPPALARNSEEFRLADINLSRLENQLVPATADEFAGVIIKLQAHYHHPDMDKRLMKEVADDYGRLLSGYPPSVMQEASDEFLIEPTRRFMPKIGEIKDKMDIIVSRRKRRMIKLMRLTEGQHEDR